MQWDVNNEMLHGSYFADRQGAAIRDWMYKAAAQTDPGVDLFVNDFDVVENGQLTQVTLCKNFPELYYFFSFWKKTPPKLSSPNKTEWSREVNTGSHNINLLDLLTTSPYTSIGIVWGQQMRI